MTLPPRHSSSHPRTTTIALASILVFALVAVAVLQAIGVSRHRPPVALVGDSITANLDSTARRQLGGDYGLTIDGKPGFLAEQQLPAVTNAASFPFEQVVINLGTNDVMTSDQDLDSTIAALTQMADTLADVRCVHFVTISEGMINDTDDAGVRARQVNDAIRGLAATRPNVRVIDWATIESDYERETDTKITTDTVHPNDVGNRLLATAYRESLDACAS